MDNGKLTQKQVIFMSVYYIFGTLFVSLPRMLAETSQHAGWLCILIASGVFTGIAYMLSRIMIDMGEEDFIPYVHSFLGRWLGPPLTMLFLLLPTLLYSAFVVRLVTELFATLVIPETPFELIVGMVIILRYWMVLGGVRTIGTFAELVLPAVFLILMFMMLMSAAEVDYNRILPLIDSDFLGFVRGSMGVLSAFLEIGILLFMANRIKEMKSTFRSLLVINWVVTILFIAVYWLCLGNFGSAFTKRLAFPTIEMVRNISFASFIEHIESIFLAMWVLMNLTKGSLTFYASCVGFQTWFGLKSYRSLMVPLAVCIYFLALVPQNLLQAVFRFEQFKAIMYPLYGSVFIILMFLAVNWRAAKRRRGT